MRGNPGGDELNPARGVRRRCKKKSSFVLSCIGRRTRKGCNHGCEVGCSKRIDGEGPVSLRKLHQCNVVCWCGPRPLTRGGSKWRDNYPEGFDHPVAPNRQDYSVVAEFISLINFCNLNI